MASNGTNGTVKTWQTTDLGSAAYVFMRGLRLLGSRRAARGNGQFVFMFADPENRGEQFSIDFLNSECREYDAAVRSLKKLCYDSEGSSRR